MPYGRGIPVVAQRRNEPQLERELAVQGYLAHKKTPNPLGLLQGPKQRPTVGS